MAAMVDEVRKLRVGVAGPGVMGGHHVTVWRRLGMDVCAFSPSDAGREAVRAAHGITVHGELAALLDAVDVVDVCVPTHVHREVVEAAARAGRHVICEKPLALTVDDAEAMRDACRAAGVQLHVAHVVRYFPEYAAARRAVESGGVGRPAVVRLRRVTSMPARAGWYGDPARSGGVAFDLMIHDIDYARWVAGDVVRVYARVGAAPGGGAPMRAYALLTHAGAALSHIEGTWGLPGTAFSTSFEIAGSGGLLSHDAASTGPIRIDLAGADGDAGYLPPVGAGDDDPYQVELAEMAAALAGGPPPRVTVDDAIQAVRVAAAVVESARSGRPVELERREAVR
jgi:predicted dehydrogenase